MPKRADPIAMPSRVLNKGWVLAVAAAVLLAVGIGYGLGAGQRRVAKPAFGDVIYEASAVYDPAVDGSNSIDNFIALPYALPLAPGEMVSVVRSDVNPEVLANMGIDVDPAWQSGDSDDIAADVVLGQDGLPRAVRIVAAGDDRDVTVGDTVQF
jgi:hypothetical protein